MRRRCAFTLIEIVIVILIIAVLVGLAAPAYERYKNYSYTRTCYANQKTVSSALQSFNLDRNEKRTDYPGVMQVLASNGYLRVVPSDPGGGPGSSANYMSTDVGHGITCKQHGPLQ
jgi:prepilin-type N-terminal cleavage/methylation domain-containing protein